MPPNINYGNSLITYGRAISNRYGLVVNFGNGAYTDGKEIVIPRLPDQLKEEDMQIALSSILHEAGHLLFTDFDALKEFVDRLTNRQLNKYSWFKGDVSQSLRFSKYSQLIKSVWNSIEDNYMETKLSGKWSGAYSILSKGTYALRDKGMIKTGENLTDALSMYCYFYGAILMGQDLKSEFDAVEQKMIDLFGTSALPKLKECCDLLDRNMPLLETTSDCIKLAVEYVSIIDSFLESDDDEDSDEDSDDKSNDNSDDETEEKSNDDSEDSSNDDLESDNEGKPEEEDDSDPQGEGGQSKPGQDRKTILEMMTGIPSEAEVVDFKEYIVNLSDDILSGASSDYDMSAAMPVTTLLKHDAKSWVDVSGELIPQSSVSNYNSLKSGIPKNISALKTALIKKLATPITSSSIGKRGRLMSSKLHRVGHGNHKVFERNNDLKTSPKAAVSMLIDLSGSMFGERSTIATQTAIILEEIMSSIKNPFSVSGFGDARKHLRVVFKRFSESSMACRGRLGSIMECVGGATPLHSALHLCCEELLKQKTSKKEMFVITDGAPYSEASCVMTMKRFSDQGISFVYFVIGDEDCSWLNDTEAKVVRINKIEDLTSAAIQAIGDLKQHQKVA